MAETQTQLSQERAPACPACLSVSLHLLPLVNIVQQLSDSNSYWNQTPSLSGQISLMSLASVTPADRSVGGGQWQHFLLFSWKLAILTYPVTLKFFFRLKKKNFHIYKSKQVSSKMKFNTNRVLLSLELSWRVRKDHRWLELPDHCKNSSAAAFTLNLRMCQALDER